MCLICKNINRIKKRKREKSCLQEKQLNLTWYPRFVPQKLFHSEIIKFQRFEIK